MNTKKISRLAPQWGSVTALGTLIVAPMLSASTTAEAAPVRYAQTNRQVVTLSGVVTQDLRGREFRMRSADGREFRVIIDAGREPRALSRNDRVSVRGYFTSGLFIANSLSITSNNTVGRPPVNSRQIVTVSGVVTQDIAGRAFRMRSADGREFRVIIDAGREPRVLSRNDRVSVRGYFASGLFIANSLTITSNAGRPAGRPVGRPAYAGRPGQTITLSGVVTQDIAGREFRMRSTNGREFRVIIDAGREPRALSRGDRVTVRGYFTSGLFIANSLSITGNAGNWVPGRTPRAGTGQRTFTGTVVSVGSSTKMWVEASNGVTYEVVTRTPMSSAITVGDSVRVTGWGTAQSLQASRVTLLRNNAYRNTWPRAGNQVGTQYGRAVNFVGTVTRVTRTFGNVGDLHVRGDNGQTYTVRVGNIGNFTSGYRVRVIGTYRNGSIQATSVTRL